MICHRCLKFEIKSKARYCPRCGTYLMLLRRDQPTLPELRNFESALVAALRTLEQLRADAKETLMIAERANSLNTIEIVNRRFSLFRRLEVEFSKSLHFCRRMIALRRRNAANYVHARSRA